MNTVDNVKSFKFTALGKPLLDSCQQEKGEIKSKPIKKSPLQKLSFENTGK